MKAIVGVLWDVIPPTAGYFGLRAFGVSTELALLGSTAIAALRVGLVAVRARRFDVIAGFIMAVYGLSLAATLVSGDDHVLLLRDSFTTGVLPLGFLVSCVVRRPLVFYAAKRASSPVASTDWDTRWANEPGVRHTFMVLTAGWGFGLLAEAVVRVPLIYLLPSDTMVGLSSVLQLVAIGLLVLWSVRYVKARRSGVAAKMVR
ncbi:VC0807 family protein [Kibdelosporangium lantanae]|uniref:VC0807 family protein n=1 Tax=Kibdelosporangium lantanae TaxID=1497396 RepID=A0ABW3M7W5_9PSEU